MKSIRLLFGAALVALGVILTILPGSTLFILAGLMILSIDYPPAKNLLRKVQNGMRTGSRKLDLFFYRRKFK
jgi:glucose dehydrogenase